MIGSKKISKAIMSKIYFYLILASIFLTSCIDSQRYKYQKEQKITKTNFKYQNPEDLYADIEQIPLDVTEIKTKKKIKIGVLIPMSGKYKELGKNLVNSAIISLFYNDRGKNIELVFLDTKGNRFGAKKAINEAISQGIKIIIGPVFSSSVKEISNKIVKNNMIAFTLSNEIKVANSKGIFVSGFIFEKQVEEIIDYMIDENQDNFSIIAPNNKFGIKISRMFKDFVNKKDGNFITSELYLGSNTKNLDSSVKRLLDSFITYTIQDDFIDVIIDENDEILIGDDIEESKNKTALKNVEKIYSDIILITDTGKTLEKITSLIKEHNISERKIKLIGLSNWGSYDILENEKLDDGTFVSPDLDKYKLFENSYYDFYNEKPIRISSIMYDITSYICDLVNENDSISISKIVGNNNDEGFEGIDGEFRFLSNGLIERNMPILKIKDGEFEKIRDSANFIKY
jgi:outer membrane PBP1 activator LpoA protein